MQHKLRSSARLISAVALAAACGYAGHALVADSGPATGMACPDLDADIRDLRAAVRALTAMRAASPPHTAATSGIPAEAPPLPPEPVLRSAAQAPARPGDVSDARVQAALDPGATERIRQQALDAFISGTPIRSILRSQSFAQLSEAGQDQVVSDMVQLVNDGLVPETQIYGPAPGN